MNKSKWERVGQIKVDAGLCWLGDPCYILHRDGGGLPRTLGSNWSEFCDMVSDSGVTNFDHEPEIKGLGVAVSTGYGDGVYPVEVKRVGGMIAEVRIKFIQRRPK